MSSESSSITVANNTLNLADKAADAALKAANAAKRAVEAAKKQSLQTKGGRRTKIKSKKRLSTHRKYHQTKHRK